MRFFHLEDACDERYYSGGPVPYPPDLERFVLGPELPDCPVRYEMTSGTESGDFVAPSLCSDRTVQLLEACAASGYRTYPVEVYAGGQPIPGYRGLQILGRGGSLDTERSGVEARQWGMSYRTIHMTESDWDGSDIFSIPGMGIMIFATQRVHSAIARAGLRNVRFIPNTECHLP